VRPVRIDEIKAAAGLADFATKEKSKFLKENNVDVKDPAVSLA